MQQIRVIKSEQEQKAFASMLHYCFQGDPEQSMFPFKKGEVAWGAFDGEDLISGLIEVPFTINLLGATVRMLGIGGVASLPEGRNRGSVRLLHQEVLKAGKGSGYAASALHPFSFRFYEKFGFGNIGPCYTNRFDPQDIAAGEFPDGWRITAPDPKTVARDIDSWWQPVFWSWYDFSDARDSGAFGEQLQRMADKRSYIRACVDPQGDPAGLLVYRFSKPKQYTQVMHVERIGWRDGAAFRALIHFIWTHRGQCEEIVISWPEESFIPAALNEPRYHRVPDYSWMARPVDVLSILQRKVECERFHGELIFSIEDPCVPENTGTYSVADGEVSLEAEINGPTIPFAMFSSMLFGAIRPREAELIADLPFDVEEAEALFRKRQIFMTEGF